METIQISKEKEQNLISLFKKRQSLWIIFIVIGLAGIIPIGISFFGDSNTSFYSSPSFFLFILGIIFWSQCENAIKKIKKNEYQAFKTTCKKVNSFGYASVENNEIISKRQNKALKMVEVLGSAKLIKADEEIGIVKVDKDFWVFSL